MADAANYLLDLTHLLRDGPDRSAATYVTPLPWQISLADITLPASKALCLLEEMRQNALQAVA